MELFNFLAQFIYFIIPGVIFVFLSDYLLNTSKFEQVKFGLRVFIASTATFTVGNSLLTMLNKYFFLDFEITQFTSILSDGKIAQSTFVTAIFVSIIMALVYVYIISNNLVFKLANLCKITYRSDNYDVWDNLFVNDNWIILRDYITNHTYYGRVEQASDKKEEKELLLYDVTVWNENSEELYKMQKIYLSRKSSEFSIEIADYTEELENERSRENLETYVWII